VRDASAAEIRVLGCLIEKQRTTPDAYPLSVNALRAACNQATNRDPVVDYDEAAVREAAQRLGRRGWARFASRAGSRAPKYRHTLDDALGLAGDELAVLCVLMLRGAQTPGELKARTERLQRFTDLADVDSTLRRLIDRELVAALPNRPGQKEQRYAQLLQRDSSPAREAAEPTPEPGLSDQGALESRVAHLEEQVGTLRGAIDDLRHELGRGEPSRR
jgi:uncharacterized protein YceH (UPF0502 family)